jgi:hypothetical protein
VHWCFGCYSNIAQASHVTFQPRRLTFDFGPSQKALAALFRVRWDGEAPSQPPFLPTDLRALVQAFGNVRRRLPSRFVRRFAPSDDTAPRRRCSASAVASASSSSHHSCFASQRFEVAWHLSVESPAGSSCAACLAYTRASTCSQHRPHVEFESPACAARSRRSSTSYLQPGPQLRIESPALSARGTFIFTTASYSYSHSHS